MMTTINHDSGDKDDNDHDDVGNERNNDGCLVYAERPRDQSLFLPLRIKIYETLVS